MIAINFVKQNLENFSTLKKYTKNNVQLIKQIYSYFEFGNFKRNVKKIILNNLKED